MFDRDVTQRMNRELAKLTDSTLATGLKMDALAGVLLFVIASIGKMLRDPKNLWDAGFGQEVTSTVGDTDAVGSSRYTKRWWLFARAIFNAFYVLLNTPMSVLVTLRATDGNGDPILDGDGAEIWPFSILDLTGLGNDAAGNPYAGYTVDLASYRKPEDAA